MRVCCFFLLCILVSSVFCSITSVTECTNQVASVAVPYDQTIVLSLTSDLPIICFSLITSESSLTKINYHYEVTDDQYLLDQDADIQIGYNNDCNADSCVSNTSVDSNNCVDTSGKLPSNSTRIPFVVSLVSDTNGNLIVPTEDVTVILTFKWSEDCDDSGNNIVAWVIVGLVFGLGIPVIMVFTVLLYLKMRKKRSDSILVIAEGEDNNSSYSSTDVPQ